MRRYCWFFRFLLVSVLLHFHGGHSLNKTCDPTDKASLLAFSGGLERKGAGLVGWDPNDASCCSWTGVSCALGRVVELDLSNRSLYGVISSSIASLAGLATLNLSRNSLRGEVPAQLARLASLRVLDLSGNRLSGAFPASDGGFPAIEVVNLSLNGFTGLHPAFPATPNLTVLDITRNAFSGGMNATALCSSPVKILRFSANAISGDVPAGFSRCKVLTELSLDGNSLTGSLPSDLYTITGLRKLSLQENQLSGSLDEDLGNSFINLPSALQVLQNLPNLTSLVLTNNFRGGETMPMDDIEGFKSMKVLVLANCALLGTIPPWLQSLKNLNVLDISWNNLHGEIPPWLGNLDNLFYIDLSNNSFSGELPESFTQMKSLMSRNGSSGQASTGDVPLFIKKNSTGKGLQYNQVSSFPPSLILSNNHLVGPILPAFGRLEKIHVLDLSYNNLSGPIPDELSNMSSLEVLNLAHNNLSGSIPSSLTKLNFLSKFDVSYNHLVGDIPTGGQFSTFGNEDFVGNALCLPRNSSCTKKASPGESSHRKKNKATLVAVGLGTAAGVVFVLCTAYVIISRMIHSRMQEHNPKAVANAEDSSESPNSSLVMLFQNNKDLSIEDILKSTNNFDQAYIVGCGGFGLVYKSTLSDGRKVAIKRLSGDYSQIEREFQAEVETLSRAQHVNLVLLEGYCKIGNDRLLIYSFMENGSLDYWLHERADGGALLDWNKRLRIAQGAGRGLAYLHLSCEPHILHRDIKSSNILLDENFEAHLADFGLARLICAYETHVTTDVVGTLGYIPPEYGQSPVATYKGDVYSFGIVLLELLTGRRPVDMCRPKGSRDVVSWVLQMKKEGRETEVFHPSIHEKENESELKRVLEIACLCVTSVPKSRPTSQQLVEWLDDIAED
ncbi:hypothetical protein GUJ93_ZPchr0458g22675 [Zizania palustris]|uniref:non-specific serine/threonine protein kinase n=1 Tax=Zizania palustris TaxID=103762 RepID=A0A8J5UUW1_ZIZPA|nr:hypothetical protein GUJ93_ZPchr0458g22675 [Zizania palustris]